MSPAARAQELGTRRAGTVRVCIKIEAASDEEAEGLREAEYVTQDTAAIKQELLWEHSTGLYADHVVKEELVLGPESLQRSGSGMAKCIYEIPVCCTIKTTCTMLAGAAGSAPGAGAGAAAATETTRAAQDTDTKYKLNNNPNVVLINTYMCDICGKLFKHKIKLIRHIKMHLKKKPDDQSKNGQKVLFCKICNKKFRQAGHLNRHEQTHSGAKPHTCEICGKDFKRLDTLKLHRIIHTGRKPYSCEMCYKQFTQLCNLTRHTRIHTGEKPYPCGICLKRFTQSCDLKKHIRIHNGDKPYSCEICSKFFTCSGDLRTHNRTDGHKRALRTFNRKKSNCILQRDVL